MRPDQERVRNLLIDTVTLLCKNSVQFKDMLHVEGLLGVSVDKKDVFFVHISKEFANSPSEGATVTHDTTDSQDEDSRLADESIDVRDGQHRQKLSDKAHHQDEQQARIKTEILEEECLIVEDPSVKLEGIVSPAQLIAGQRRSMKRTSHSSLMAGGSGSGLHGGDNYDEDISVPYSGEGADNSHYSHMGEPPSKRKASDGHHHTDDGYNVTAHGEEDPGGTPWPSIASVPGFDPTQQSFQQDSDNSQMSITDGTQPGCSSWSTPGRGPSDSVPAAGEGDGEFDCWICGEASNSNDQLEIHLDLHTDSCSVCGHRTGALTGLCDHLKAGGHSDHNNASLPSEPKHEPGSELSPISLSPGPELSPTLDRTPVPTPASSSMPPYVIKPFERGVRRRTRQATKVASDDPEGGWAPSLLPPVDLEFIPTDPRRRFPCGYCGKAFTDRYKLSYHVNIHTGAKPFNCPFCNYSTGDRRNCDAHVKRNHRY